MFGLGLPEMVIVGIVAVLLFGKRLPDVARSLGGSYNQFRRGLQDIQSEFNSARHVSYDYHNTGPNSSSPKFDDDDYDEPTAPKIELPPRDPPDDPSA